MTGPRTGFLFALTLAACSGVDPDLIELQGTVEVREVDVSPLVAGRVTSMHVDEGQAVTMGDTVAILTAPTLGADLDAARARVMGAEATLRDLEAGSRPQEVAAAEAAVRAAEVEAAQSERDRRRAAALLEGGAIAPREHDLAVAAADAAAARLAAAREQAALLRAGTRPARIAAARSELAAARAALAGREASTAEYVLTAPVSGVVMSRVADPGDLLATGTPVAILGVLSDPWVRIYVPARVLPMIQLGMETAIYPPGAGGVSSATTPPGRGRVVAINPQAEYVTRTALTEEERADLLFGVKVAIDAGDGRFKPGLPVVVALRIAASDATP
jgi:HlyD family secretion protein